MEEFDYPFDNEERLKEIKDRQAKIYAKYMTLAILAFIPSFIGIFGVELYNKHVKEDYKNVVLEKGKNSILIKDLKTKDQRILTADTEVFRKYLKYILVNDTIELRANNQDYKRYKVFEIQGDAGNLKLNKELIHKREQEELFKTKIKEIRKER